MIHGGAIKVRSYSSSSEEPADLTRMNLRHIISQLVWECFSVASCLIVSAAFPQVFPFLITLVLCLALFSVCLHHFMSRQVLVFTCACSNSCPHGFLSCSQFSFSIVLPQFTLPCVHAFSLIKVSLFVILCFLSPALQTYRPALTPATQTHRIRRRWMDVN